MTRPNLFWAFPWEPRLNRETVQAGLQLVADVGAVDCTSWTNLTTSGRVVFGRIADAIRDCDVAVFDLTTMNLNVLFELGYAISMRKPVWCLLNTEASDEHDLRWKSFRQLTSIGYSGFGTSTDIRKQFLTDSPHLQSSSLFEDLLRRPLAAARRGGSLLYLRSPVRDEADRVITRTVGDLADEGAVFTLDPDESNSESLAYLAARVYESDGVLVHLTSDDRTDSASVAHNMRASLLAGFALGLGVPLRVLGSSASPDPIDYRDIHVKYESIDACSGAVSRWLKQLSNNDAPEAKVSETVELIQLDSAVQSLSLGEHVAENEASDLPKYFVETAEYTRARDAKQAVLVGRKGTGKTAAMLMMARDLRRDQRNLVCVIKPQAYDLSAVADIMRKAGLSDVAPYVADALWQYLIVTEIAKELVARLSSVNRAAHSGSDRELVDWASSGSGTVPDFSVRLDEAVSILAREMPDGSSTDASKLVDLLHRRLLPDVTALVAPALRGYARVVVLIDNLDKAWDRHADTPHLSRMILGSLTAIGNVERSLRRVQGQRRPAEVDLVVFLRSDIFYQVNQIAREPDKLPATFIDWPDADSLVRLISKRVSAAVEAASPDAAMRVVFDDELVDGGLRDMIEEQVVQRPRDVIFLCNSALLLALNRGHGRVHPDDVADALEKYSSFAFNSLKVENGVTQEQFEDVLLEFMISDHPLPKESVDAALKSALGNDPEARSSALKHLLRLGFLGVQTRGGDFVYAADPADAERVLAIAAKYEARVGSAPLFAVHPAYRPYLGIDA